MVVRRARLLLLFLSPLPLSAAAGPSAARRQPPAKSQPPRQAAAAAPAAKAVSAPKRAPKHLEKGLWNLSINYPGAGVRAFFRDDFAGEFRFQTQNKVRLLGPRFYFFMNKGAGDIPLYFVGELDHVSFKTDDSKGKGYAVALLFGGERFTRSEKFSFQFEVGPAMVRVKDSDTSLSDNEVHFVVNFGMNFFPGRR
jgi:hypothetical protein